MVSYQLKRSNRKTIGLYICDGAVEVRAPLGAPRQVIDQFVASKEPWIADKLAASAARQARRAAFALHYDDAILYGGKEYPIAAKPGDRIGFDGERFYIPPGLSSPHIKHACVQIYRMLAKRDLTNRVLHFAPQMGVMPAAVKINGAKTRWGSCSSKKSLNFSWRLVMAAKDVVDYVVIHELAHITEMNHSAKFWAIVADVLPDYKERQARLNALQQKLGSEDWD